MTTEPRRGQERGTPPSHARPVALVTALALLTTLLSVVAPTVAFAAGTVVFQNSFVNNAVDGIGTVSKPVASTGSNVACLTAAGNAVTPALFS